MYIYIIYIYIYEQETSVCMCCVVKINKKHVCLTNFRILLKHIYIYIYACLIWIFHTVFGDENLDVMKTLLRTPFRMRSKY